MGGVQLDQELPAASVRGVATAPRKVFVDGSACTRPYG
jgi:hypothetical protein